MWQTAPILILPLLLSPVALASGQAPGAGPAKSISELRAFYAANCARCHGPDGSGQSAQGKRLKGMDFTDAAQMAKESDAMMVKTIRKGIFFGVVMPPFKKRLTEAEVMTLVKEILRKAEKGKVIAP
jgi:mono/diheme cytochrome c family protein